MESESGRRIEQDQYHLWGIFHGILDLWLSLDVCRSRSAFLIFETVVYAGSNLSFNGRIGRFLQ
jgi:hypothetical protein